MDEATNDCRITGKGKETLVARVDGRVIPALDQIASANQSNTSQMMGELLDDIADAVGFLGAVRGDSFSIVEDRFAKLILERCHGATPKALQAMGHIWYRAADILSSEEGG
jgi:hypothetical protein